MTTPTPSPAGSPRSGADPPLCVDLDGTLIRSDLLQESLVRLLAQRPWALVRLPWWWAQGRARLKAELASRVQLDVASLPYVGQTLDYLAHERRAGRRILLVTASHETLARAVAQHLGLFDDVIATSGTTNLKGAVKRAELERRFGASGFDYAGDSAADLAVWAGARRAVLVDVPARVARRVGTTVAHVIRTPRVPLVPLVTRAIRVGQWVKNLLVFLPALLAHRYLDAQTMGLAALSFLSFSLGASAVYVLNDLCDVEADRHHPRKSRRPFAAGELSLAAGGGLAVALAAASFAVALALPGRFLVALVAYFVLTGLYSLRLKQVAVVDILMLAGLYTLRILAGSMATAVEVSEWLLAFSMFFFLSLAAMKRYGELLRVRRSGPEDVPIRGRGYYASDLELIVQMGVSSGYLAVLVLVLYITSHAVSTLYGRPGLLWLVGLLLLFWLSRSWLLAHRGQVQDDPLTFAARDGGTWIAAALAALVLLLARGGR